MRRFGRTLVWVAVSCGLALAASPCKPVFADAITKVRGTVTDWQGKPMAKVKIWFQATDVNKKVGPLTTNKDGKYAIATLDISVAKKWKVIPDLTGYKVVKVHYEIVDSENEDRGSGDVLLGSKQEYPELQFALPGDVGRNVVDLLVAKDADFLAAYQAEKAKREGGAAAATAAAPAGAAPAGATPPGGAPAAAPDATAGRAGAESLKKAKELADAGHNPEAIEMYRAFLTKDPTGNPAVYYYLGKSLYETEDDAAAEQAFKKGLELKPDMKGAHFFLGNLHLRGERFAEAAAEYEKEAALTPENDSVWINLGLARAKAGEDDKAIEAFEKASALNPARSEPYMEMAALYEKRKDKAKAEEMYQKIIAIDPQNAATSFYNIGVHAWNENRDKEAAQAFRKALEVDPRYAAAHKELARVLTRMQDFPGAVQHYQEYLKLNPQAPDAKEIREMIVALKG